MATGSTVLVERYNLLLECLAALEDQLQEPTQEIPVPAAPTRPAWESVNIVLLEDSEVTGSRADRLDIKIEKPETFKGDAKLGSTFLVSVSMYCGL